jgi:hypothetical protein
MSVNREKWHLLIKPEDDANRQIANGFVESLELQAQNKVQLLPPAGGWVKALEFIQCAQLERFRQRRVLILIDFDKSLELRRKIVEKYTSVSSRVFVVGAKPEAEDLRREMKCHFEECGERIAGDCVSRECAIWKLESLDHNEDMLNRLCPEVYANLLQ